MRAALVTMALMFSMTAWAFRSTDFESFTDPAYPGYRPSKIIIVVQSGDLDFVKETESRVGAEFSKKGVEVFSASDLFPPTRPLDQYDVFGTLAQHGIDSALLISAGERSVNIGQFGSTSHSTVNAYGNHAQVTTTTTPQIHAHSRAAFNATLTDIGASSVETKTVWMAQILVKASGTFFVGNKSDARGAVRAIVRGLVEDGHLPP